ncbi:MAG: hypothetical protein JKY45_14685 [Emcibacter sp.]|nr:hypothetical protein [Emcibacter sp.]
MQIENSNEVAEIRIQGANSGQSFLIASPKATEFPAALLISSLDGNEHRVVLKSDAAGANLELPAEIVTIGSAPVQLDIVARSASSAPNDTRIIVEAENGKILGVHNTTAISSPTIQFQGRFQCRLATDPDPFDHSWGTDNSGFRAYSVQGPDAANPDEPPLDRIIRFHDPVAMREFCEPVGVFVHSIQGLVGGQQVSFRSGDAVLGAKISLGPDCVFDSQNGAISPAGWEPISDFSLAMGAFFFGKSEAGAPRRPLEPHPTTAPYAEGVEDMDATGSVKPANFGYAEANWKDRGKALVSDKLQKLQNQQTSSGAEIRVREKRLHEHQTNALALESVATLLERYSGKIHIDVDIDSNFSPVAQFLGLHQEFSFFAEFFNFDSDGLTGSVWGRVSGKENLIG